MSCQYETVHFSYNSTLIKQRGPCLPASLILCTAARGFAVVVVVVVGVVGGGVVVVVVVGSSVVVIGSGAAVMGNAVESAKTLASF